jgi:hypothetical protein
MAAEYTKEEMLAVVLAHFRENGYFHHRFSEGRVQISDIYAGSKITSQPKIDFNLNEDIFSLACPNAISVSIRYEWSHPQQGHKSTPNDPPSFIMLAPGYVPVFDRPTSTIALLRNALAEAFPVGNAAENAIRDRKRWNKTSALQRDGMMQVCDRAVTGDAIVRIIDIVLPLIKPMKRPWFKDADAYQHGRQLKENIFTSDLTVAECQRIIQNEVYRALSGSELQEVIEKEKSAEESRSDLGACFSTQSSSVFSLLQRLNQMEDSLL